MWPFKKEKSKGIKLAPGESMEINFLTSWRRDKEEVFIITEKGPIILDGKNELFIEVTAENIDPVKLQVVPDFKNRNLNFVEIIDPKLKKKFTDDNGPRLKFSGGMIKERAISFDDYLRQWDKNIKMFEKTVNRSKWIRNIFIPFNIISCLYNSYSFMTKSDNSRYINLGVAIFTLYIIYYIYHSHKKLYDGYKQYKEKREETFGVVKEK